MKAILEKINELNLSSSESDNESESDYSNQSSELERENNLINKLMDQFDIKKQKIVKKTPTVNVIFV